MGKVFSWNEIVERKVPEEKDFEIVLGEVKDKLANTDSVVGAIITGSISRGEQNRRSDIDCFVLHQLYSEHESLKAFQEIQGLAAERRVPVGFVALDTSIAETPFHGISGCFYQQLKNSVLSGWVIKQDPLPSVRIEGINRLEDTYDYIKLNFHKIKRGMISLPVLGENLYNFLQTVLSSPVHLARKMLFCKGNIADQKKKVVSAYIDSFKNPKCYLLKELVLADEEYTKELEAQLENPDKEKYQKMIDKLKEFSWKSLEFFRFNAAIIRSIR